MDKRTIIAVVLSVTVMVVWFFLFPGTNRNTVSEPDSSQGTTSITENGQQGPSSYSEPSSTPVIISVIDEDESLSEYTQTIETDLVRAVFSTKGGDLVSYRLKKHLDNNEQVELTFPWENGPRAFTLALGDGTNGTIDDLFKVQRISDTIIEFYRDYSIVSAEGTEQSFRLTKRWEFRPGEYMFQLDIKIDGNNMIPSLSSSPIAYTMEFGPQLGPEIKNGKSKGRFQDFRDFWSFRDGKVKKEKIKNPIHSTDSRLTWTGIIGKYFMLSVIPDATQYTWTYDTRAVDGLDQSTRLRIGRPALRGSNTIDIYRFYLGPKVDKDLALYNVSDKNSFRLSNTRLNGVLTSIPIIGPLETLMKWIMMFFHRIIPNYGVAIILLTILVKALMFPITKKGSESTLRMQTLSPKIKELQAKYKDNPTKLNAEMAELYKKEGYNPLSGCLPMLIQIPIFFAMYNLFNNHFDLRGAMFIPGWIPDLSQPEYIFSFAPGKIPLLGWSEIRLLPFLYLGSQLLYGRINQTAGQQSNTQMMMFMYVMPIMFFFILYDVPAGLLIYWIMSNVLSLVQQIAINKINKEKLAANAPSEHVVKSAILPPGKRKKNK